MGSRVTVAPSALAKGCLPCVVPYQATVLCAYRRSQCHSRNRQREFLVFLASLEAEIPSPIQTIHVGCETVSTHHGKEGRQWLQSHPRFVVPFTPGPLSNGTAWLTHSTGPKSLSRKSWLTHQPRRHDFRHLFLMSCT